MVYAAMSRSMVRRLAYDLTFSDSFLARLLPF